MKKETYDVTGMSCAACSSRVEKAVAKQPGAQQVAVNLLKNSMVVEYDESQLSSAQIIAAVEKAGYGASLHAKPGSAPAAQTAETGGASAAQKAYSDMKKRLALSLLFTIPLFYLSMGHMMGWPLPACFLGMENAMTFAFTQFLLLLPIVYINRQYYIVGFKTLWQRSPNMDSLIALGSSAAIVYGIYAIYKIGIGFGRMDMDTVHTYMMELYFESAGTILTLITMGKTMEARAKGKTSDAITKLMDLAPKTATVERNGVESVIPVEEVQLGDVLIVKAGESVPVDGVVLECVLEGGGLHLGGALVEHALNQLAHLVGALAHHGTILGGELAHHTHQASDAALAAEQLNARGLELGGVVGACDELLGLFLEFDQIINQTHVFPFVSRAPRLPRRLPPSGVAKTRPGSVTKNRPRACALPKDG